MCLLSGVHHRVIGVYFCGYIPELVSTFKGTVHPSEQAKRSLDNHVGNYVASFQTSLGSLFGVLPSASANSEALLDSEYKLRQHLSLGYEDIHKLIMDYYEQKTSAHDTQIELPSSQTSPAKPSPDELPTDIII